MLQAPVDINAGLGCGCGNGFGDASGGCSSNGLLTAAVMGALAFWLLPHAVTGFIDGAKQGIEEHREEMARTRKRRG